LGYDAAGSNDWTPNNFSVTAGAGNDSLVDSPTRYGTDTGVGGEVRGNYATLNPLSVASAYTLSNGNLQFSATSSINGVSYTKGTQGVSSGKWYWEVTPTDVGGGLNFATGIVLASSSVVSTGTINLVTDGYVYHSDGNKYSGGSSSAYGATLANNDVVGVALDLDAGTLTFYKNNTSQGTAYTGLSGTFSPLVTLHTGGVSRSIAGNCNFGQRPFAYTAPSGFKALCTTNLPEPTIAEGSDYFNAVTYTGNNQTLQSITTVGFQPDLIWIKNRNASNHVLVDAVRGRGFHLASNLTNAEATDSSTQGVTAFLSNGFSVEADPASYGSVNDGTNPYVAWNWKANGAGSSNTAGTISSTVSANTTAGFSIVTYTGNGTNGASVGHGLGVAPAMVIVKQRNGSTYSWTVQHTSVAASSVLALESTSAAFSRSTSFNSTYPTSTVFSLGTDLGTNSSSGTYVAYCFAPIAGYSAFGSYTGNGSTDGPFVFTGFRPAFVMYKRTDTTGDWWIQDVKRSTFNPLNAILYPNASSSEYTAGSNQIDYLSNGFKLRTTNAAANASGGTYVYMAFAENPFSISLAR